MAGTIAHAAARLVIRHAVAHGISASTAAGWLGVPVPALERPGRMLGARVMHAWAMLQSELSDPAVALRAARHSLLSDYGLFGFCVSTAPTLRAALHSVVGMVRLLTEMGSWEMLEAGDLVRCVWSRNGAPTYESALADEVMVSTFVSGIQELIHRVPLRVEFAHRAPQGRAEHGLLLGCDVCFGRKRNVVLLEHDAMNLAPGSANLALFRFLNDLARREIVALAPSTVCERVSHFISSRLKASEPCPEVTEVARNLGMSERTLRRRLSDEGASFRSVRALAQLQRAAELMDRTETSLTEIALECGFADPSAFSRAWKRSLGVSPSHSRKSDFG